MANIINCGNRYINLDYLVRAYLDGKEIFLEMADGVTIHLPLSYRELLSGRNNVVQAFPVKGLYANYKEDCEFNQEEVMFMGVCANGEIRPLGGRDERCIYFLDEGSMYDGLSDTKMDEQTI